MFQLEKVYKSRGLLVVANTSCGSHYKQSVSSYEDGDGVNYGTYT